MRTGLSSPNVKPDIMRLLTGQLTLGILKYIKFPDGLNNYHHLKRDLYHVVTLRNCSPSVLYILRFKNTRFLLFLNNCTNYTKMIPSCCNVVEWALYYIKLRYECVIFHEALAVGLQGLLKCCTMVRHATELVDKGGWYWFLLVNKPFRHR
jgi:hypothetical protein